MLFSYRRESAKTLVTVVIRLGHVTTLSPFFLRLITKVSIERSVVLCLHTKVWRKSLRCESWSRSKEVIASYIIRIDLLRLYITSYGLGVSLKLILLIFSIYSLRFCVNNKWSITWWILKL